MSSRDTFVTSYIYDDDFRDDLWDVLDSWAYAISDEKQNWISGLIKNCLVRASYFKIDVEIGDLIRKHNYEHDFNMVIIGDDFRQVISLNENFEVL